MLKIQDVYFSYPGQKTILKKINLAINKNDLVIIKGESGSGKSTFLKLLNRFNDPSEGTIYFHNQSLQQYHVNDIRKSIMYLPQLPCMIDGSVEHNLSFPFRFQIHRVKKFNKHKAVNWIQQFALDIDLSHDAQKLSVGQKQRLALIRAILLEPEILLLDEPGSSLDSRNRKLIEDEIQTLVKNTNVTIIMATHGSTYIEDSKCRTFFISKGEIVES